MRALSYFFQEALLSLWRRRRSALLAVATIATAVFVLGGFLLVTSNLERLLMRWNESAEFSIYLRDEISQADRAALVRSPSGRPRESSSRAPTRCYFPIPASRSAS